MLVKKISSINYSLASGFRKLLEFLSSGSRTTPGGATSTSASWLSTSASSEASRAVVGEASSPRTEAPGLAPKRTSGPVHTSLRPVVDGQGVEGSGLLKGISHCRDLVGEQVVSGGKNGIQLGPVSWIDELQVLSP